MAKTIITFASHLHRENKELYVVPNDILISNSPDQFAMARAGEIREMKSGLKKNLKYLFNELRYYLPGLLFGRRMRAHVSYSQPINLTRMLVEDHGMKRGRFERQETPKAVDKLSSILLDELLNGAVVFEEQLPAALMAYAANGHKPGPILAGSSGELSLGEATFIANEWLSNIHPKHLPERYRHPIKEGDIRDLFSPASLRGVADVKRLNYKIIFSNSRFAATYSANAFQQVYSHYNAPANLITTGA